MFRFWKIQLFTIRDPLEVESAKLRRNVLIPIKKLKLSRNRHDGTQMMSFLYFVVVSYCSDELRTRARTNSFYFYVRY
jgi:hypothetical protein